MCRVRFGVRQTALALHVGLELIAMSCSSRSSVRPFLLRQLCSLSDLLAREDESLLVGRNAFLLLDGLFDLFDAARSANLQGHGLACERSGASMQQDHSGSDTG